MPTITYEEMLASQTELAHFNQNHDPSTGRFSKSKFGKAMAKRKEHSEMKKDMDEHFRSQISDEASKVTTIGRNGYDNRGSGWNSAYRKGKVSSKDDREIKKAAANTREYMIDKYGEKAVKSFQNKTGESALSDRQKQKLKGSIIGGTIVAAGSIAVNSVLADIGTTALQGAGIDVKLGVDPLKVGAKALKTGLAIYGGMTLVDMYKSHKREQARQQKDEE